MNNCDRDKVQRLFRNLSNIIYEFYLSKPLPPVGTESDSDGSSSDDTDNRDDLKTNEYKRKMEEMNRIVAGLRKENEELTVKVKETNKNNSVQKEGKVELYKF